LIFSGYITITESEIYGIMAPIYNFIALFILSLIEFAGNVTVPDSLIILPKVNGEDETTYKMKKFQYLFGPRFWIWMSVTGVFSLAVHYLPFAAVFFSGEPVLIVFHFLALAGGIGFFIFFHYRTLRYEELTDPSMIVKAADYYNLSEMREQSIELLENYIKNQEENIVLMSKLSLFYLQENKHKKVLNITKRILEETEEKSIDVPLMISKAYLLRAISLKNLEKYKEAYQDVTSSLKYTPNNQAARKLRRDLRRVLKLKEQEKG
jgi:tetratricopeptide (TPR) repeat protein